LHNQKVTVWCALSSFGILGPYFFWKQQRTCSYGNFWAHLTDVVFQKKLSLDMLSYWLHKSVFLILTENKLPSSHI
jgi:hypothetical protein